MGIFGKSFEEAVRDAALEIQGQEPGLTGFEARVEGRVVTLVGVAASRAIRSRVMEEFTSRVKAENTVNQIRVEGTAASSPLRAPERPPAKIPRAAQTARIHLVKAGETLGAIAGRYYGDPSLYMRIFEANRDQLDNPNFIRVGQRLVIPEE